jgi:hypothetical protein
LICGAPGAKVPPAPSAPRYAAVVDELPGGAVSLEGYYIVGRRPVWIFRTPEGGLDCQVYDWATGDFTRDMSYLSRVFGYSPEIDEVSRERFEQIVAGYRLTRSGADGTGSASTRGSACSPGSDPAG